MPDEPSSWIALSSTDLSAAVNPLGAQLSILRDGAGRDLLWNGDPSVWAGRAPVLFPIVGTLAGGSYRLGAQTYRLSRHGFARGMPFEPVAVTASGATFRLQANETTLQVYPFHFELAITFAVAGPTLTVTTLVRNSGATNMPASFGYHPAFRWPLPYGRAKSAHFIEFESEEPAPLRRLNADGLLSPTLHPTPISHRRLALEEEDFRDDVMIFDAIRSRSVTYGAVDGPRIRVSYPDAPYLGFWQKPGADFICIEPWHGVSDPEGFSGDFTTKPGVVAIAPGTALSVEMAITLLDP